MTNFIIYKKTQAPQPPEFFLKIKTEGKEETLPFTAQSLDDLAEKHRKFTNEKGQRYNMNQGDKLTTISPSSLDCGLNGIMHSGISDGELIRYNRAYYQRNNS